MEHIKEYVWSTIAGILTVLQFISSFFYYNETGFDILRYLGYLLWIISVILGWAPIITLRKEGGVPEGKSYINTTMLVTSGIYSLVRHPQYLAWYYINLALILIVQHWLITVLGVLSLVIVHVDNRKADQGCIEKFGDAYREYMKVVPRMNLPLGIVRWIQRKNKERTGH